MKKIHIIKVLLVVLSFGIVTSCSKDFLDLTPKVNQLAANFYQTESDAMLAIAAVYNTLVVQPWEFVPIMADIRSDDAFTGGSNSNDMAQWQEQEHFKMSTTNAAALALWQRCYDGIYRANLLLSKMDGIAWTSAANKARCIAECQFLRGYFYWDLVRHFGWVPILTSVISDNSILTKLPQSTPDQVYHQVVSDMLAALPNLPAVISVTETGRVGQDVAKALLSRIYLYYKGVKTTIPGLGLSGTLTDGTTTIDDTWAKNALKAVINSGHFHLLPNYADVFALGNQNNAEEVFSFQYSQLAGSSDWGGWGISGNFSVIFQGPRDPVGDANVVPGWSFGVMTFDLAKEYETGDPRKAATLYDASVNLTKYTRGYCNTGYFNSKFLTWKAAQGTKGDPSQNFGINYPDIRFADVLLMYAELDMTGGLTYFNQVRTRALGSGAAKGAITLADIQHERRVEFGGEGHRCWDLMRWDMNLFATRIAASWSNIPTGNPMINVTDFTPYPFIANTYGMFPIPATEIQNSSVLKQFIPAYQ